MSQSSTRLPLRKGGLSRRSFGMLLVSQVVLMNASAFAEVPTKTARAFLQKIYAAHLGNERAGLLYEGREDQYFSPELVPLFKKYAKKYEGELGDLDFDIFTGTQDWERPKVDISIAEKSEDRAIATVTIVLFKGQTDKSVVTYDLVKIGENWRIENMHWRGMKHSLLEILKRP